MSDYFEWKKDDLEQLKIGDHEFINYLREGLIPYRRDSKTPIPCPKEYHEYRSPGRFYNSQNEYSDPCHFFHALQRAKSEIQNKGEENLYSIILSNPLYALCLKYKCYQEKRDDDLVVSYKNIKELEKISKQDYIELQNKMGCDPAKTENLLSWRFILSFEDDKNNQSGKDIENCYRGVRDYLLKREGAVFKKSEAREIQEKANVSEEREFKASSDFRTVRKDGKKFELTSKQAQVIQMLWEAHKDGLPGLGKDRILEDVSGGSRLRDIFKSNPKAFKALIKQGERRRGICRLNI